MKSINSHFIRPLGLLTTFVARGWMSTLDYKLAYYDPRLDPAILLDGKLRLYIFWHEFIPFFVYQRPFCHLSMLLSRHKDADILEQVAHCLGFGTVRGSTARGGSVAVHEMMRQSSEKFQHLTITPDGPRGPRRKMAPGAIYLASRLGIDLVPLGVGYDRPWRTPTWDRFAIPRPGTRARLIAGPSISIPANLDREGMDHFTMRIESLMNRLCDQAEDWAIQGYQLENAANMAPGPRRGILYFAFPKQANVEG